MAHPITEWNLEKLDKLRVSRHPSVVGGDIAGDTAEGREQLGRALEKEMSGNDPTMRFV